MLIQQQPAAFQSGPYDPWQPQRVLPPASHNDRRTCAPGCLPGVTPCATVHAEEVDPTEPRTDIVGLLGYLDSLIHNNLQITEVRYVINDFYLAGVVPLKHHGFAFKVAGCEEYFSLDFGRNGIMWNAYSVFPEDPEGTCFVKSYAAEVPTDIVRSYCGQTEPFSVMGNDCSAWSKGLLKAMGFRVPRSPR